MQINKIKKYKRTIISFKLTWRIMFRPAVPNFFSSLPTFDGTDSQLPTIDFC